MAAGRRSVNSPKALPRRHPLQSPCSPALLQASLPRLSPIRPKSIGARRCRAADSSPGVQSVYSLAVSGYLEYCGHNGVSHHSQRAGHADVSTTQIYTHVMNRPGLGLEKPSGWAGRAGLTATSVGSRAAKRPGCLLKPLAIQLCPAVTHHQRVRAKPQIGDKLSTANGRWC